MLKRSYDSIFKDHYFVHLVQQNMLTCFNVQKTHYFSSTVHYCSTSMPRLSQMSFSIKPLLPTSAVCSDWPADTVHCDWRTLQAGVGNVMFINVTLNYSFSLVGLFLHAK